MSFLIQEVVVGQHPYIPIEDVVLPLYVKKIILRAQV